jgi:putative transcriptional regulator
MPTGLLRPKVRSPKEPHIHWDRVRATTDAEISDQIAADADTAPDMSSAIGWRRVFNPPIPDIKRLRRDLGLSQSAFARRFGFSVRTVQQWEQGRAVPDRPARILLKVIERAPDVVERILAAS